MVRTTLANRRAPLLVLAQARSFALRSALAAMVAWLVVVPLGGVADEYPYYAPLGALVAVTSSVDVSLRTSAQTFGSLVLGATLGTSALLLDLPRPVSIGLVVGAGCVLGSVRWLGTMGSWVPISGLFVLVLGEADPAHFVLGYLGLTTLGALVGAATSALLPPLHLARTRQAQDGLRAGLADQLDALAGVLRAEGLPTAEDWDARRPSMRARSSEMEELLALATGGPPVNWRVLRGKDEGQRLRERGRALAALALQVDEMTDVLSARERDDRQDLALPAELRPAAARALRATAEALRSVDAHDELLEAGWAAARELAEGVRRHRRRTDDDLFTAGSLVVSIERTLTTMGPTAAA